MAFKSLFVGVGRHADPNTPDLPGPPRDARAMQSLFKDSLDGGEFDLLVDEQATTRAISSSLDQLFSTATDEDTLLFHFSGHGSENHDLIPHDIDDSRVSETTIPMGQILELLRTSEAKNIICFLDCCFSGGVGAKVLPGLPRTRDSRFSFDQMAGEGRVIVAASEQAKGVRPEWHCRVEAGAHFQPGLKRVFFVNSLQSRRSFNRRPSLV